jgi:hypothetical protein
MGALFEFGKYLIALSRLQTKNPNYRDTIDSGQLPGEPPAEMLIHSPARLKEDGDDGTAS